jgi:hypothetical protein
MGAPSELVDAGKALVMQLSAGMEGAAIESVDPEQQVIVRA